MNFFDIYLASPYSHPDKDLRESRYKAACHASGYLISQGHTVFSPISHGHGITKEFNLPGDWEYWKKIDRIVLPMCMSMVILIIDGWKDSKGILAELQMAGPLHRPLALLRPDPINKTYEYISTPISQVLPLLEDSVK
jgi:hypothetical protein